jgi:hypothetical protein
MEWSVFAAVVVVVGILERSEFELPVVPSQNLKPDVLMMESAKDRYRRDTADLLRPAKIRSIFVQ